MKIGELARCAGVTIKAVRYYESLGLITPRRLANGYRDYTEDDARLVREIRILGSLGIPVERTRPFLACLAAGRQHADDCPESLAGYREAVDELTERIEALTARRAILMQHLRQAAYRNSGIPLPDDGAHGEYGEHPMSDLYRLPENLPVPEDDGAADHLPGLKVPRIELSSTTGEKVGIHALGTGRTIVYVYPLTGRPDADLSHGWDAIPGARGCTAEACDFRDHHHELLAAGAQGVFGLSSQDTGYQREVVERLRLPFAMLSDPRLSLAAALGLPTFAFDGVTLFKRLTLVIRDEAIEHVFYPVFPPDAHAQQVLAWLRDNPAE
ncbi:redoxin family protein [Streptomyces roseoverticillatus]|uniref:MerR family DNA-binding transcriptional regulator n=1 Tax=Streptomyces roseoverticillatus TaxID=66429 RepID=UPI001F22BD58|nr:MerR family DNA-binding transcriptional regulator [Streptomyces roseoverticillatus]MCF3102186.1 redoxin family protein [Streptomyces roseoverticillatus]